MPYGSYRLNCSQVRSAASRDGTRGNAWGLHASGRWEDPCRPWHYGPAGGHQGKQHDTQRTHRHGRCHPGSSFHHQWVNQGTSRATVSGLGCRSRSSGIGMHSHGILGENGTRPPLRSTRLPAPPLLRRWTASPTTTRTWTIRMGNATRTIQITKNPEEKRRTGACRTPHKRKWDETPNLCLVQDLSMKVDHGRTKERQDTVRDPSRSSTWTSWRTAKRRWTPTGTVEERAQRKPSQLRRGRWQVGRTRTGMNGMQAIRHQTRTGQERTGDAGMQTKRTWRLSHAKKWKPARKSLGTTLAPKAAAQGTETSQAQVRRHALLIALSPDGDYIKPGGEYWGKEQHVSSVRRSNVGQSGDAERLARETSSWWRCPTGLKQTGPHTGDTWSRRLRGAKDSSRGSLCLCNANERNKDEMGVDMEQLTEEVAERMARQWSRPGTISGLLRDLAVRVGQRAGTGPQQEEAEQNFTSVLQALRDDETEPWDVSPTGDVSPKGNKDGDQSRGQVSVETASRGLGVAGRVDIPEEMWQRHRPCNWREAHENAAVQKASRDPALAAMVQRIHEDGMLDEITDGRLPNAKAFTKPKSQEKGSLIINMVPLNKRCQRPNTRLQLPTLEELGDTFREAAGKGQAIWFCKLDVANMFWSCWMPEQERGTIRIGVQGRVWGFHSLPFGWTHSPLMATELLRMTLEKFHMPGIRPIQYVDDVLVYGYDKTEVGAAGLQLRELLERDGWICSPKSQLEPTNTIEWMGKSLDGRRWTIQSSAPYIAGMVALWLKLATRGYSQKDMRRMLGKLAWADRPARETGPHTSGAMAWMMWGPQNAKYTPPKVLRGLAEALASVMGPWTARRTTAADDIDMYVDAAEYGNTYLVGLWSQEAGARVWECPKTVRNQQAAELQAVERAVKMAAYRRRQQVHLGADNLAAIWAALKRKTKIHHRDRATTVRRIQQTLRWSGIVLKLSYVPSKWNPADAISRIFNWGSAFRATVEARACELALRTVLYAPCSVMGQTSYRS